MNNPRSVFPQIPKVGSRWLVIAPSSYITATVASGEACDRGNWNMNVWYVPLGNKSGKWGLTKKKEITHIFT